MKKYSFLLGYIFFTINPGYSQTAGPQSPMQATYSAFGCLACPGGEWSDLQNISFADHQYTKASLSAYPLCFQTTCFYSRILYAYNFGFNIPPGAVINGISAEILRMATTITGIQDSIVTLYLSVPVGNNHASPNFWTTIPLTENYGDSTDTWGYPLTADSVNNGHFGMAVMVENRNASASFSTVSIDNIQMTIYYSTGLGVQSQTKSPGQMNCYYQATSSTLTLNTQSEKITDFSISDITGRIIFTAPDLFPAGKTMNLNIPVLKRGLYFLSALVDGRNIVQKITAD